MAFGISNGVLGAPVGVTQVQTRLHCTLPFSPQPQQSGVSSRADATSKHLERITKCTADSYSQAPSVFEGWAQLQVKMCSHRVVCLHETRQAVHILIVCPHSPHLAVHILIVCPHSPHRAVHILIVCLHSRHRAVHILIVCLHLPRLAVHTLVCNIGVSPQEGKGFGAPGKLAGSVHSISDSAHMVSGSADNRHLGATTGTGDDAASAPPDVVVVLDTAERRGRGYGTDGSVSKRSFLCCFSA
jgi:hypothetical protein